MKLCNTTDSTTYTITDLQLVNYLDEQGMEVDPNFRMQAYSRKARVTKIKWYGKARNGNFDLYIKNTDISNIKRNAWTVATIVTIIGVANAPTPQGVFAVGTALVKGAKGFNTKHGKIFKVKSWKYTGAVNQ